MTKIVQSDNIGLMSRNQYEQPLWAQVLEREADAPFEDLMQVHDSLSLSEDSGMRYNAAWAALYASLGSQGEESDAAYDVAINGFQSISAQPLRRLYTWTGREVPLKAAANVVLLPRMRSSHEVLTNEQRTETYQQLAPVLAKTIEQAEKSEVDTIGFLGELTVAALCWRPQPATFSQFNTFMAGPMKDSRQFKRFATDLYAYHPLVESTRKGRVNIQVKLSKNRAEKTVIDRGVVAVIALNELVDGNEGETLTGKEAGFLLAQTILKEACGENLDEDEDERLLLAGALLFDKVMTVAEQKRERLNEAIAKKRSKSRTRKQ